MAGIIWPSLKSALAPRAWRLTRNVHGNQGCQRHRQGSRLRRSGNAEGRAFGRPATFDRQDAFHKTREAERARDDADRLLKPPSRLVGSPQTELVPAVHEGDQASIVRLTMVDTLAEPNTISVSASEQRASVANRANVLAPALDAAVTTAAKGSVQKLFAHQIAALHHHGMEMLVRATQSSLFGRMDAVELTRYTNAAVRMFEASQGAALTLQKLQSGGTQRVVVQYQQQVNVSEGGQAVVAGKVNRGSRGGGKGGRNA